MDRRWRQRHDVGARDLPGQRLAQQGREHGLRVGLGRQDMQRPAQLPRQLAGRPGRVLPLHLGHGDPDRQLAALGVQHARAVVLFGELANRLVDVGEDLHLGRP